MRVPVWRGCSQLPEVGRKPHAAYTGADKEEYRRREERGKRRRSGVVVGREGGKGALANLQEGRLSHETLAELQPLCMAACVCVHVLSREGGCVTKKQLPQLSQQQSFNESGAGSTTAAEQKACKLRMCSVEAWPNLTLC